MKLYVMIYLSTAVYFLFVVILALILVHILKLRPKKWMKNEDWPNFRFYKKLNISTGP